MSHPRIRAMVLPLIIAGAVCDIFHSFQCFLWILERYDGVVPARPVRPRGAVLSVPGDYAPPRVLGWTAWGAHSQSAWEGFPRAGREKSGGSPERLQGHTCNGRVKEIPFKSGVGRWMVSSCAEAARARDPSREMFFSSAQWTQNGGHLI